MSEKHSLERKLSALQIKNFRNQEKNEELDEKWLDRSGKDYLYELKGLKHLFDYVRSLPSHKVLDIGAGTTKGISEIAKSNFGVGLDFEATVLFRNQKELEKNLGKTKTHSTSSETIKGLRKNPIEDESYGAILSLMSVTYTKDPETVVKRINELLVPGGVFKGNFSVDDRANRAGTVLSPQHFAAIFEGLGYKKDVDYFIDSGKTQTIRDVFIAIKPDTNKADRMTAKELYETDWENINNPKNIMKNSSEV
jgi:SAM-dependent methyltransferase